jgi:hypothetical protein
MLHMLQPVQAQDIVHPTSSGNQIMLIMICIFLESNAERLGVWYTQRIRGNMLKCLPFLFEFVC